MPGWARVVAERVRRATVLNIMLCGMVGVVLAETVNVSLRYDDLVERWSVYST